MCDVCALFQECISDILLDRVKNAIIMVPNKKVKGCTHFYQRFFINFLNKNPISLLFVGIECSIFTFSWLHQLIDLLAILLGLEERIKSRCKANNKCR